jgi:hypothetical protein
MDLQMEKKANKRYGGRILHGTTLLECRSTMNYRFSTRVADSVPYKIVLEWRVDQPMAILGISDLQHLHVPEQTPDRDITSYSTN